jgi:hypothetical protein
MFAVMADPHIIPHVSLKWNRLKIALIPSFLLLVTGCGGFSASPSVSPATFLLPGLGQTAPPQPAPVELAADSSPVQPL